VIETIRQGLKADGIHVSMSKLCQWFGVPVGRCITGRPRRHRRSIPFAGPIKAMIKENPSFGYRTVAHLLDFNKNAVQRIFQLKGWQVKKRPIGFRPRVQVLPSVAHAPNAGRRTCARSGPVATSGPRWRWSSTAIPRTAGMAPAAFGQGAFNGKFRDECLTSSGSAADVRPR
jgi:hypothetical protein